MTPTDRWNLIERARCTVDGTEYVVVDDGVFTCAMPAAALDAETDQDDYSLWCAGEGTGEGRPEVIRAILRETGLEMIHAAGSCTAVTLD